MPGKSQKDEQTWNDAKHIFNKSYGREPSNDSDWKIVNAISQKIKQGKQNYTESFVDELKKFLKTHINNPLLTILIVKYISNLVGKSKFTGGNKMNSFKENKKETILPGFNKTLNVGDKIKSSDGESFIVESINDENKTVTVLLRNGNRKQISFSNIVEINKIPKLRSEYSEKLYNIKCKLYKEATFKGTNIKLEQNDIIKAKDGEMYSITSIDENKQIISVIDKTGATKYIPFSDIVDVIKK